MRAVSGFFKSVIEAVVSQANSNIIEKSSLYRMTRIPPLDLVNFERSSKDGGQGSENTGDRQDTPLFLKDAEHSFDNVMSYGHDFKVRVRMMQLLIFNIVVYQVIDIWSRDTFVSIFVTYIVELLYVTVKVSYQTNNISLYTLVDETLRVYIMVYRGGVSTHSPMDIIIIHHIEISRD